MLIKVVQFLRKKTTPGSVEILFNTINKFFSNVIEIDVVIPKYESRGLFKRIAIILESYFKQGDINHITGNIHFASFLLKKRKTILTIHDCVLVMNSKGVKRAIFKLIWFTLPMKKVEYVTVISEKTKKEVQSLVDFPEDKIFIIPDCISDQFKYVQKPSFNTVTPRILHVGTRSNKNLLRVCESLKGIPCLLDIVGELSTEQLTALNENGITYETSAHISEETLIQKYIEADIVVFVSTYEGFGMPILEAQTVGRALLTSNISPMTEISGEGACFVDPHDVDAIRDGFLKIINNENYRNQIIKLGLENVKKYHPEKIASMYETLYVKLNNENNLQGKSK